MCHLPTGEHSFLRKVHLRTSSAIVLSSLHLFHSLNHTLGLHDYSLHQAVVPCRAKTNFEEAYEVRAELLVLLMPFMQFAFDDPWSLRVEMADASLGGHGRAWRRSS